ncbi:MAG: outer membrane beta-barrel protein [Ferruginibacter sp.]
MRLFLPAIIFCLLFCNISFSQTRHGNFVISGGTDIKLLFSRLSPNVKDVVDNQVKMQKYAVNAGLGYFIIDDLAIHITTSYEYSYSKKQLYLGPVYGEDIQKTLAVIPSLTYYFPVEGNVRPTINLGAGYVSLKERNNQYSTPNNVVYHYGGLSLNAGAGVSFFLNSSLSVDVGFQYSRNKLNDKTHENLSQLQNMYGAVSGLSVYF